MIEQVTIFSEGGPIETLTVIFYGAGILAARYLVRDRRSVAAISALLAVCIVREAGLRRPLLALAQQGPVWAPFVYWTVAAAMVAAALTGAVWLAWLFMRGPRVRGVGAYVAGLVATAAMSQVFDRLPKIAFNRGYTLDTDATFVLQALEESLEMSLPVLVIVAMYRLRKNARNDAGA